jgi:hypothetical protein
MLLVIELGILSGFLSIFLNYLIGKPGSEFSPYEIFSGYTVWLSIKRLQRIGLYPTYANQYNEGLKNANSQSEIITLNNDFKKMLYNAADPFFTWERAVGMCSICTGFWITLGVSVFFTHIFFNIVAIVVISHITIRLLNKVL